ncbi:hypothetical protein [Carnobacterium maltaromaticum]|uniref:Uncharacterized protein n=1 Tax=Carnobacterium maltaromaticum LMA28 TaxID=1234679 RepID=K8E6I0_CARML|nr:hypothetical protein [Carnobacterium maltaromaticum]KRN62305.1 hypothetical protein IV70_GL000082 [Carnobacterium maltaromaticum DSM 20342]CCO12379.2 hypothetical protein BN424_2958 [Carnobacterium maltaromaticum LMA28]
MHKIVRFPITDSQKKQNTVGKGFVPCEISEKYLNLKKNSFEGDIVIKVMKDRSISGEIDHEICELVVSKSMLLKVLDQMK